MRKALTIFVVLISLLLCACAPGEPSLSGAQTAAPSEPLTPEYFLEVTGLTEADLDGIDFNAFVSEFALTADNVQSMCESYDMQALLDLFRWSQENGYVHYDDIYLSPEGKLTADDLQHIQVLTWEYHEGSNNAYMVIDVERSAVYYSMSDIISRCSENEKVSGLRPEDLLFVETCLQDSGILKWKNEYTGTGETTTGHFSWSVGFKLTDGRCIVYHGSGVQNSETPQELKVLLDTLRDHFA